MLSASCDRLRKLEAHHLPESSTTIPAVKVQRCVAGWFSKQDAVQGDFSAFVQSGRNDQLSERTLASGFGPASSYSCCTIVIAASQERSSRQLYLASIESRSQPASPRWAPKLPGSQYSIPIELQGYELTKLIALELYYSPMLQLHDICSMDSTQPRPTTRSPPTLIPPSQHEYRPPGLLNSPFSSHASSV